MRGYNRVLGKPTWHGAKYRRKSIGKRRTGRIYRSKSSALGRALGHSAYVSIMKSGRKKSNDNLYLYSDTVTNVLATIFLIIMFGFIMWVCL